MKLENGGRIEIQGEISGQSEIAAVISTDGGETEAEIQQTALLIDMDIAQTDREMALEVAEMVRISTIAPWRWTVLPTGAQSLHRYRKEIPIRYRQDITTAAARYPEYPVGATIPCKVKR